MKTIIVFIAISISFVFLNRCGEEAAKTEEISGQKIYSSQCALCHGSNGDLGASGASPLSISKLTIEQRIEVITNGRGKMMPYSGLLSPEEISAVSEFIETLKK